MALVEINSLTPQQIASICDHTYLNRSEAFRATAKPGQSLVELREEAFYDFLYKTVQSERLPYAVCVRPEDVRRTTDLIEQEHAAGRLVSSIKTASVVGFPDGSWYGTAFKAAETVLALRAGATEVDMVLNYNAFKAGKIGDVSADIQAVTQAAHAEGALVKLILETCELTPNQIKGACGLAQNLGVDFVKTSTGFGAYGATVEALRIMRDNFEGGIKISGGVTKDNYQQLLEAASGRTDRFVDLDPKKIRIGESSLLKSL